MGIRSIRSNLPTIQAEPVNKSNNCAYPGCKNLGSMAHTTHANDNTPWYCRYHFSYKEGDRPTPEEQMAADAKRPVINPIDKQAVTADIPKGPRRWAHEILALRDAGMYFDNHGIEMAERVIRMDKYIRGADE